MGIKNLSPFLSSTQSSVKGKRGFYSSWVPIKPGGTVIALYDSYVLYLPLGAIVDEALLVRAIKINK